MTLSFRNREQSINLLITADDEAVWPELRKRRRADVLFVFSASADFIKVPLAIGRNKASMEFVGLGGLAVDAVEVTRIGTLTHFISPQAAGAADLHFKGQKLFGLKAN